MGCHSDWLALLTAFTTAISFLIAILTPPTSGPFCVQNGVGYPYTDIAAHISRDFLWMYPALLPAPLSIAYGFEVEHRFEVAAITVDWTVLIVAGALLARTHARQVDVSRL